MCSKYRVEFQTLFDRSNGTISAPAKGVDLPIDNPLILLQGTSLYCTDLKVLRRNIARIEGLMEDAKEGKPISFPLLVTQLRFLLVDWHNIARFSEDPDLYRFVSEEDLERCEILARSLLAFVANRYRVDPERLLEQKENSRSIVWEQLAQLASADSLSKDTDSSKRRGRRSTNNKDRNRKELLVAALLKHHHFGDTKSKLKLSAAAFSDLATMMGTSEATTTRALKDLSISYKKYRDICDDYQLLRSFLDRLDIAHGRPRYRPIRCLGVSRPVP